MNNSEEMLKKIKEEYAKYENIRSKEVKKIANTLYKELVDNNDKLIEMIDSLMLEDDGLVFPLMTLWIKRRKAYDYKYFNLYEKWLKIYVNRWGRCDIFSYHVLNPMFERYPEIFNRIKEWIDSDLTYVRRAAPVIMIKSTQSFEVNADLSKVLFVVKKLANDNEMHVQKGVGWLLKYAYLSYPKEIEAYLRKHVNILPRLVFRYALEKVPKNLRKELMKL